MSTNSLAATVIRRLTRAGAVAAAVLLLWALPVMAVGVDGVEVRVDLPTGGDDRPVLDLRAEDLDVEVRVRNTTGEQRDVRVYAVAAHPAQDTGSFDLAGPTSADWFGLDDQRFTLEGRADQMLVASADPRRVPEEATHVAVVLETGTDSTVVTRAARVISLSERDAVDVPLWLVLLAAALLALAVAAHLADWRQRTRPSRRRGPTSESHSRGQPEEETALQPVGT